MDDFPPERLLYRLAYISPPSSSSWAKNYSTPTEQSHDNNKQKEQNKREGLS